MKWILWTVTSALLLVPAAAQEPIDIGQQLRHTLENKLLALRTAYADTHLKFSSQGKLLGKSEVLPWTIKGLLLVKKLNLKGNSLEIEGERVIVVLDKDQGLMPIVTRQNLYITIELDPPLTEAQLDQSLRSVFASDNLQTRFSEGWKSLSNVDSGSNQANQDWPQGAVAILEGGRFVYKKTPDVTAPTTIYAPEPKYPSGAVEKKVKGRVVLYVVVDESGFPEIIEVLRSLGKEFDVEALYAASEWRFSPSLKKGKPVAVAINIDVDFRP